MSEYIYTAPVLNLNYSHILFNIFVPKPKNTYYEEAKVKYPGITCEFSLITHKTKILGRQGYWTTPYSLAYITLK
jgi:hypothetical protein